MSNPLDALLDTLDAAAEALASRRPPEGVTVHVPLRTPTVGVTLTEAQAREAAAALRALLASEWRVGGAEDLPVGAKIQIRTLEVGGVVKVRDAEIHEYGSGGLGGREYTQHKGILVIDPNGWRTALDESQINDWRPR